MTLKSICVFCGSKNGNNPSYEKQAKMLGLLMAEQKIDLVYGGGSIGLMGVIADSVLENKGSVFGVIPKFLAELEIEHRSVTELFIVSSMHERKQKMEQLSDGVIAMPGGFGTLEELAEILTWAQLGLVQKPIGLLNANGYYKPLIQLLDNMVKEGFLSKENRSLLIVSDNPESLLKMMTQFKPGKTKKILETDQT